MTAVIERVHPLDARATYPERRAPGPDISYIPTPLDEGRHTADPLLVECRCGHSYQYLPSEQVRRGTEALADCCIVKGGRRWNYRTNTSEIVTEPDRLRSPLSRCLPPPFDIVQWTTLLPPHRLTIMQHNA